VNLEEDNMRRILIFLLLLSVSLMAYRDMDLDGVEDRDDKCPNTPLSDLVDLDGCTIKSLVSNHHFNISIGEIYKKDSDLKILSTSIRVNYFYKDKISIGLSSSYFKRDDISSDSGLNNTYIFGFYNFKPTKSFSIKSGVGISLPTYDSKNNRLDYSLSSYFSFNIDRLYLLGGLGYNIIGDKNLETLEYQNSPFFSFGFGYAFSDKIYSSLNYIDTKSIYKGYDNIRSLSLYNNFKIDRNWFLNLNYMRGLNSASVDNSIGVRVGYSW